MNLTTLQTPTLEKGRLILSGDKGRGSARLEYYTGPSARNTGLEMTLHEEGVTFHAGVRQLASVFLTLDSVLPHAWLPRCRRATGIRVFEGGVWINIWDDTSWSTPQASWSNPKAWRGIGGGRYEGKKYPWSDMNFFPADALLGRREYSKETLSKHEDVRVPLPEGNYEVSVTLIKATWKRPRSPFTKTVYRAEIDCGEDGIGVPGKGTAAHNCGPDAIYSMTCEARSVGEAVGKLVGSVLHQREKYPL